MSEFLQIRNWHKFQPGRSGKSAWIKDYTDKDSDPDYEKLTFFERQVLDGIRRLRGRLGKNPPNDPQYVARALYAARTDRPHVPHAVATLLARGFLILSNQQLDSIDIDKDKDKEEEKKEQETAPKTRPRSIAKTSHSEPFKLPEDIPSEPWNGWLEMRQKIKRAPTVRAMEQAVEKLRSMRTDGHDPGAVLDQSTFNNWQGLFPLKNQNSNGGKNGREQKSAGQQRLDRNNDKYTRVQQKLGLIPQEPGNGLSLGDAGRRVGDVDSRPKLLPVGGSLRGGN